MASFTCRTANRYPGGDHTILVGAVEQVTATPGSKAMVHFRRGFYAVGREAAE